MGERLGVLYRPLICAGISSILYKRACVSWNYTELLLDLTAGNIAFLWGQGSYMEPDTHCYAS